jgi:magnesium-protoporphyrin IX monomethyl ester (oxidative) cyclase
MQVDFALLPFYSIVRPSLGIGLLQSLIEARGHLSKAHYLNLAFAERVGAALSEWTTNASDSRWLLGEWVFSAALFPAVGGADKEAAYVREIIPSLPSRLIAALLDIRRDASNFIEWAADLLVARKPDVLGISSSFQQNCASLALARAVKARDGDIIVCLGGANCEGEMGGALAHSFGELDVVFSGEADSTFPAWLDRLARGEVPGRGQDRVVSDPTPLTDLSALPPPKFDDYFAALEACPLKERVTPGLVFETSRGCFIPPKNRCGYCGLNGAGLDYRTKSGKSVIEEINYQKGRFGVSRFAATDNIIRVSGLRELLSSLAQQGASVDLFFEVPANLRRADLKALARAGVTWIQPGIETLDDALLGQMRKGGTVLERIGLLRDCLAVGVRPAWNLLMGIPDEAVTSYDTMLKRIPLIEHLPPPEHCERIRLDRFSPFYRDAATTHGSALRPVAAYQHVFDLPEETVAKFSYFFRVDGADAEQKPCHDALAHAVRAWRRRFFSAEAAPVCAMLPLGDCALIKDTRTMASMPVRTLNPCQTALLRAFDRPSHTAKTLTDFEQKHPDFGPVDGHWDDFLKWGYILQVGPQALALPVPSGHRVRSWQDPALRRFPGGYYTPEAPTESDLFRLDDRARISDTRITGQGCS